MVSHKIIGLFVSFAILSLAFWVLQHIWPSVRGQKTFRTGFLTDCVYWLWTPVVTRVISPVLIVLAVLPIVWWYGMDLKSLLRGHGALASQPLWLQGIEIFVVGDFLGYWQHRLFHGRLLWPFHSVHHSSRELDWLSSVRLHPVNDVIGRFIVAVPLVAAGFNVGAVALYAPFATVYAIMIHANLDWDFGPLRYVIASPTFHRWHHTKEAEGLDKNFSGGLPIWDLLFGTFYMPRGEKPALFGIDDDLPEGFIGQMLAPFGRRGGAGDRTALLGQGR